MVVSAAEAVFVVEERNFFCFAVVVVVVVFMEEERLAAFEAWAATDAVHDKSATDTVLLSLSAETLRGVVAKDRCV